MKIPTNSVSLLHYYIDNSIVSVLLCFFVTGLPALNAQNFEYPTQVLDVIFHAPPEGNEMWINIYEDPFSAPHPDIITPPIMLSGQTSTGIYTQSNVYNPAPVGYVSGSTGKVSAIFSLESCLSGKQLYVKGKTPYGFELPWQHLVGLSDGSWRYNPANFNQIFPVEEVQFYENFQIDWYLSDNTNSDGVQIATSKNDLFITHKISDYSDPMYVSFLYLGCKNASGKKIETEIVDNIYSDFLDQCVTRYHSTNCMEYWGGATPPQVQPNPSPTCWTAEGLIAYEDATCGAWADLFHVLLEIQGITGSQVSDVDWNYTLNGSDVLQITSDLNSFFGSEISNVLLYGGSSNGYHAQFLVKDWALTSAEKIAISEDDGNGSYPIVLNNGNKMFWREKNGVVGQGNENPRSEFNNHAIVKYNSKYYDPSYGSNVSLSSNEWENSALAGFGSKGFFLKTVGGELIRVEFVWIGHLNNPLQQSNINP